MCSNDECVRTRSWRWLMMMLIAQLPLECLNTWWWIPFATMRAACSFWNSIWKIATANAINWSRPGMDSHVRKIETAFQLYLPKTIDIHIRSARHRYIKSPLCSAVSVSHILRIHYNESLDFAVLPHNKCISASNSIASPFMFLFFICHLAPYCRRGVPVRWVNCGTQIIAQANSSWMPIRLATRRCGNRHHRLHSPPWSSNEKYGESARTQTWCINTEHQQQKQKLWNNSQEGSRKVFLVSTQTHIFAVDFGTKLHSFSERPLIYSF